jgi:transcriptional antiterminator RfaH
MAHMLPSTCFELISGEVPKIVSDFSERQWYVIYCKPQKEAYAQFHLQSKGLEVFFPKLLLPEISKIRKRVVPLFPNYLFAHLLISSTEYLYAAWSPGVRRIVSFNGCPAPIDEQIVKFFIGQANHEGIIAARTNLRAGQEVRIAGGPLDGLVGIMQEPPDARGRVKILLTLLNRQTNVEVPIQFIRTGWVASGPSAAI